MLCYGFPWPRVPACSAKVSSWLEPLLHLVHQITFRVIPHTSEQDSQPTTSLISKQVIPHRPRGGSCCLGVSTPKTSRLEHDKPHHLMESNCLHHSKPCSNHSIDPHHSHLTLRPQSPHITTDGRPTLSILTQAKLSNIKMERLAWHSWLHG
jgi:hypothetical protein